MNDAQVIEHDFRTYAKIIVTYWIIFRPYLEFSHEMY